MEKRLDVTKPQKVSYCIPLWLRDEQIKIAIGKVKARIQPYYEKRTDPVALVCFGPSLNDTWEEIKKFKYIISCSGAHKFLIERGIIPTYHCECDPREHKIKLIGEPHSDVEYLIASTCHPTVFDHLNGFNVKLWHVFDNKEDGIRTLPPGEWALTGGASIGLRTMVIARFMGFTEFHIFGMDGSLRDTTSHAAEHPNKPNGFSLVEYEGQDWKTTPALLEPARQTFYELDQMPDVKAIFYGEGLVQTMAKNYKPNPVKRENAIIGINKPELISPEYLELNKKLHQDNLAFGVGGGRHAETVLKLCESIKSHSVLDWGCGKGYLAKALPFPIWEYDPAIPGKTDSPRPADLCVCFDVLEHIEPERLMFVLDDLRRCTLRVGYFVIRTDKASKTYANGENTHLIQKGRKWWEKKLKKFFIIGKIFESGPELHVVVAPVAKKPDKIYVNKTYTGAETNV